MASSRGKKPTFLESLAKQAPLVSATIGIAIIGGTYFLLVGPLLTETSPGGPLDVQNALAEVSRAEADASSVQAFVKAYRDLDSQDVKKIETALPRRKDVPGLLAGIEGIVKQAGLQMRAIEVSEMNDRYPGAPDIAMLSVALSLDGGDYAALKRLLATIEHHLRLTDVATISFSAESSSYTLAMRTYYLMDALTPSPAAAAPVQ